MTSKRDVVFPADRHALYELHRYSPAIRSNGFMFVSGQVGSRKDGSPEHDLEAQVRLAFANLNAILAEAGCSFDDVVDTTIFYARPRRKIRDHLESSGRVLGRSTLLDSDRYRCDLAGRVRLRDQGDRQAT